MKRKINQYLILINLVLLSILLIQKIGFFKKFLLVIEKTFLIPLYISIVIFYIVKPLNELFIKKGLKRGSASMLTIVISSFLLCGLINYFSEYSYGQFTKLLYQLNYMVSKTRMLYFKFPYISKFINMNEIYKLAAYMVRNYVQEIGSGIMKVTGYFINAFSYIFLIIVIVFYMLKDGHLFKDKVLSTVPQRHREICGKILKESNKILNHYVTGQAKVAMSLAIMVFIGYKFIGIPNALLLSVITFILAFIPFIGFFISMIIPSVIALGSGIIVFIKLIAVFLIVQTLKGRVVVPAIMASSMKIHPLTDIVLVIGAVAIGGTFAAFFIVPVYAIIKNTIIIISKKDVVKVER